MGRIEDIQEGNLDLLIASLAKFSKKKWIQAEAEKLLVHNAKEWGLEFIFRHLWDKLLIPFCNSLSPAPIHLNNWPRPFTPWC